MRPSPFAAVLAVAMNHLRMMARMPIYWILDLLLPVIIAFVPLLLGRSIGGSSAASAFARNTGTPHAFHFMLLGSVQFVIVGGALFNVGSWIRRELQAGTLESMFTTPTNRALIVGGVCLYGILRDLSVLAMALAAGSLLGNATGAAGWGVDGWGLVLAFGWVLLGSITTYALAMCYAALVLHLKEVSALTQLLQGAAGLLMGAFFPIALLPQPLQVLSWCFPPSWSIHGLRALLLDMPWRLGSAGADLAVMLGFAVATPWLAVSLFRRAEARLLVGSGFGGV